ncbi:UNVERIFIED_ORG: hypothetical protein GGI63_005296 [Rhizobium esperanzae]
MGHPCLPNQRMRYGPGSSWKSHDDRGSPSSGTLSKRYGINQKTVAKWRNRSSVADLPTGPKEPRSTVLSIEEEAVIVAFGRYTLLPLDDCLYVGMLIHHSYFVLFIRSVSFRNIEFLATE